MPAIDRNSGEPSELALAPGERVRVFDRVFCAESRRHLANNGDVVTVLSLSSTANEPRKVDMLRVRTDQGIEGTIALDRLRARKHGPVRLAYGYAGTIDSKQGATARDPIAVLLHGSRSVAHGKAYTALSRHTHSATLVIDEASERREIARRVPLGEPVRITEADIWRNVAANLARQTEKGTALGLIGRATDLRRGGRRGLHVASAHEERREGEGITRARVRVARQIERLGLSQAVERATETARRLSAAFAEKSRQIAGRERRHEIPR